VGQNPKSTAQVKVETHNHYRPHLPEHQNSSSTTPVVKVELWTPNRHKKNIKIFVADMVSSDIIKDYEFRGAKN
jgi:hypothetical protein